MTQSPPQSPTSWHHHSRGTGFSIWILGDMNVQSIAQKKLVCWVHHFSHFWISLLRINCILHFYTMMQTASRSNVLFISFHDCRMPDFLNACRDGVFICFVILGQSDTRSDIIIYLIMGSKVPISFVFLLLWNALSNALTFFYLQSDLFSYWLTRALCICQILASCGKNHEIVVFCLCLQCFKSLRCKFLCC